MDYTNICGLNAQEDHRLTQSNTHTYPAHTRNDTLQREQTQVDGIRRED